jgi:hypothetical protein
MEKFKRRGKNEFNYLVGCGPHFTYPTGAVRQYCVAGGARETAPFPGYQPLPLSIKIEGYPENGSVFTQPGVQISPYWCGLKPDHTLQKARRASFSRRPVYIS